MNALETSTKPTGKVDFIGIGAQRSGTSWIFRCLEEHPEIAGAIGGRNKELNFFNFHYTKGYQWYHRRFVFGHWKTGEYSTHYLTSKNVPERIHRYNPDVKILLSLRNPIHRAFSQHKHQRSHNRLPKSLYNFSEALKQNPSYVEQGEYAKHLKYYLDYFDPSQIHTIIFDDIVLRPSAVLKNLFEFLEVDIDFQPSKAKVQINASHTRRSDKLNYLSEASARKIRQVLGARTLDVLKATKIPAIIRQWNRIKIDENILPPLSEDTVKDLHEFFRDGIKELEELIARPLPQWK